MKKTTMTRLFLLIVLTIPFKISVAQSNEELKAKIQKMNSEMIQAILAGDQEKNLILYTNDAISMPSYQPMVVGIDAIKKTNMEMEKAGMKITSFDIKTVSVTPAGKLVVEIGTYAMSMTTPGSDQPVKDNGKYITIWEVQTDGSLKIKVETWNTDLNPWGNNM